MRPLLKGQSIAVRYKDRDFQQALSQLQHDSFRAHATLLCFVGMPKVHLEIAARELAAALGKNLYRIDLQAVSNKYIGETEKNLERLFQRAVASESILLFDEADALFGKRSDIRDSHDRYNGVEISYLETLLSRHAGIVIALFKSVSEAERRRHRVRHLIVRFPPL